MAIAVLVVTIALAIYLGVAAVLNIFYLEEARKNGQRLGLSPARSRFIGYCQLAGVIGLVGGLFWRPLAIAAAIGFLVMMVLAVLAHRRVGDSFALTVPAIVIFLLTAFVLGGHIAQLAR
ncbi:DoxX family protein [Mycolicibacterium sp. XJ870]